MDLAELQPTDLVGYRVLCVAIAGGIEIGFGLSLGERPKDTLRIESPLELRDSSGARTVDWTSISPDMLAGLQGVGSILGATVEAIVIEADASIRLTVSGNRTIFVPPDPDFEAWMLFGPDRMLISPPGGRFD